MQLHIASAYFRAGLPDALVQLVSAGQLQEALSHAQALLIQARDREGVEHVEIAQLCGDLSLAMERSADAEEHYQRAVKMARHGERGTVRVASCRATGLMSLYLQRFTTAVSCFSRLVSDDTASPRTHIEALCALAMARHGLGQVEAAESSLRRAQEMIATLDAASVPALSLAVALVRADLLARLAIRSHESLRDHVFWQNTVHQADRGAACTIETLGAFLQRFGHHKLAAAAFGHLRNLVLASEGDVVAERALEDDLGWLRRKGLDGWERHARLELALVAIARRNADSARLVLEPLQARKDALRPRWNFELWYCLAKISAFCGRSEESMKHYQRYALESMECARAEVVESGPRAPRTSAHATGSKDDVEMRLPAKYRRAYRYIIEHLESSELSVREVSEHMGVTERALQSVFKSHLGMTPGEVMQRSRVERIRADLLSDDSSRFTVIETAMRWGIRNRSTLVSSYRKHFRETPAETLARGGNATLGRGLLAAAAHA
jgi:AraC-like DNA-binding protein